MNSLVKVLLLEVAVNVVAQNYNHYSLLNTKISQNRFLLKRLLKNNEYALMNFTERATKYGFHSEIHTVVTEDGYILKMFRLIQPRCAELKKPPVLMNHGAFLNAMSWIDNPPDTSLAYLIADSCYDLWLGNTRGTEFSRRHVTLNPKTDPDYWQFSWHEMGVYDLPRLVDHILEMTGSEKVNFIGHSQGAAGFFVLTSLKPDYMKKFGVSIALAPATFMKHTNSLLFLTFYAIRHLLYRLRFYEALVMDSRFVNFITSICGTQPPISTLCANVFFKIDGRHEDSITQDTFETLVAHTPDSISLKSVYHFSQSSSIINRFRQFDYGERINRLVYDADEPPDYNISSITTPVAIVYGNNDRVVNSTDVETLRSKLKNVIDFHCVDNSKWNHIDFVWSKYIPELLYPKVIEYLSRYSLSSV